MTVPAFPTDTQASTGRRDGRLAFLDAVRGVAVGLVLVQHVGERLWPALAGFTTHSLQIGQMGVMLFFLCSGFIIPASLERGRPDHGRGEHLRSFWTSRFFRLYPLYWVSLGGALSLHLLGMYTPPESMDALDWVVGITMLQMAAGVPNAIGLYWSLAYEMAFYVAVSALFALGWQRRSVFLAMLACGGCALLALLAEPILGISMPLGLFCLATMFTGTVFYRWHTGCVTLRTLVLCVTVAVTTAVITLMTTLHGRDQPEFLGARSFVPMLAAWLGAYIVFCLGMVLRRVETPAWLQRFGTISYSVYLMQALVLALVPPLSSTWLSAALWVAATVALSELTYRIVEQPAIGLSRRLAGRQFHQVGLGQSRPPVLDRRPRAGRH